MHARTHARTHTHTHTQAHYNDPEKLVDLHYSLAKSFGNSPELRQTWLDSMAALHLKHGNYSEAAHCCIHIAGLVAEYLKMKRTSGGACPSHDCRVVRSGVSVT